MTELSPRQKRILDFIADHVREHGYPPSVREIGAAVHLRSSSTVHGHLSRLEGKGYLRRDPSKPRTIELLQASRTPGGRSAPSAAQARRVPILGRVAAGQPLLAVEDSTETFPLPTEWIHDDEVFLLTVEGESMVDAGILPADMLVVRRQQNAYNGDIVVALLGEEVTVKRFFREAGRIRLQPENSAMQPIFVDTVSILGKVVGLVRRM